MAPRSRRADSDYPVLRNRQGNPTLDWLRAPVVGHGRRGTLGVRWRLAWAISAYLNLALAVVLYLK